MIKFPFFEQANQKGDTNQVQYIRYGMKYYQPIVQILTRPAIFELNDEKIF